MAFIFLDLTFVCRREGYSQVNAGEKDQKKAIGATAKGKKLRRLSSAEFLKVYNGLWREGPRVKYKNPDAWIRVPPEDE